MQPQKQKTMNGSLSQITQRPRATTTGGWMRTEAICRKVGVRAEHYVGPAPLEEQPFHSLAGRYTISLG